MTTANVRDDQRLAAGLADWLQHRHSDRGSTEVVLRRPTAGFSNETLLAAAAWEGGGEEIVVRLPPLVPSYPEHDLRTEAVVHRVLRDAGFAVPRVIAVEDDDGWLGAPFLVMEHVHGTVAGQAPGLDPWITQASGSEQQRVQEEFVDALARLHRIDWRRSGLDDLLRCGLDDELTYWSAYIDWASDGSPPRALADALAWCRASAPQRVAPTSLLWGDARLGNVMYDDTRRIVAVLDWELATLGPAEMDVAWYLALDELTTRATGSGVPGFGDRATLLARYEARLGRELAEMAWHEIFALVRSTAINDKQARIAAETGAPYPGAFGDDNPVLRYVARRIDRYRPT